MQLQTKGSEPMRTNIKTLLSTAAVVAALAIGPAVYAYAETPMQNESGSMMQDGQGGMMQDGQGGQGGMMGPGGLMRSEARPVGKGGVSKCRFRWSPAH